MRTALAAAAAAVALAAAGCGLDRPEPGPPPPPQLATGYANPVFAADAPDPAVLRDGATYWAYTTGDGFPILRSDDLVHWAPAGRALPERPAWAVDALQWHSWAPSPLRIEAPCPGAPAGPCFALFFTALSTVGGTPAHCVGVAVARAPQGPFDDLGPLRLQDPAAADPARPIGCGDERGLGLIDPAPFVDADGRGWLYVSTDRRCEPGGACRPAPHLAVIPLAPGLLGAAGPRTELLDGAPGTWEQAPGEPAAIENPWVVRRGAVYHLLYSAGSRRAAYGMGHATGPTPAGPFVRSAPEPILAEAPGALGPGGGMVVQGPRGGDWLVYHARSEPHPAPRTLRIDPFVWGADGARPRVDGPSASPRVAAP